MKQYILNIWNGLFAVLIGMKVTLKHMFVPAVTIQYPDVKLKLPERERNRLYVNMDDCIGCDQCARACPVDCISIETVKSLPTEDLGKTSNGKKKALWVTKFDIDIAKCCYCQLCVFPCPTECIYRKITSQKWKPKKQQRKPLQQQKQLRKKQKKKNKNQTKINSK